MKKIIAASLLTAFVVTGVGYFLAPSVQAFAQQKAAATAVGVVDIRLAIRTCKEFESVKKVLDQQKLDAIKQVDALKAELKGIEDELGIGTIKVGTPEYDSKMQDYTSKKAMFEVKAKLMQQQLSNAEADQMVKLYRKVCKRAGKLAEDRGYDVLLTVNLTDADLETAKANDAQRLLQGDREVIWTSSKVNLTDDLVAVLNNEYTQR